jgi:choline kinase
MASNDSTLILAAGFSKRMGGLTTQVPKSLLPIGGQNLLERLLNQLDRDMEKFIVLGYKANKVKAVLCKYKHITSYVTNKFYVYGHSYSLLMGLLRITQSGIKKKVIVIHADLLISKKILKECISHMQCNKRSMLILSEFSSHRMGDFYLKEDNQGRQFISTEPDNHTVGKICGLFSLSHTDINAYIKFSMQEWFMTYGKFRNWEFTISCLVEMHSLSFDYQIIPENAWLNVNTPSDINQAENIIIQNKEF